MEEIRNPARTWNRLHLPHCPSLPGDSLLIFLTTSFIPQGMWVITKKMSLHPFVILFLRDVLLTPQVPRSP